MSMDEDDHLNDVAIIGMDVRVPGAATLDRYWENVRNGVESITFFDPEPAGGAATGSLTSRPRRSSTTSSCSTPASSASPRARRR